MLRLQGRIQHYAWGSPSTLAEFSGLAPDGLPWAEIWYGAHPSAPAIATGVAPWQSATGSSPDEAAFPQNPHPLTELIAANPAAVLGPDATATDTLPYLVKLLAAAKPLSLQAHPTASQAAAGFAYEQQAGIPVDQRNYADSGHKPETLFALVPTHALGGFRVPGAIIADLLRLDSAALVTVIDAMQQAETPKAALKSGFETLLRLDQSAVDAALATLARHQLVAQPSQADLRDAADSAAATPGMGSSTGSSPVAAERGPWGEDALDVAREILQTYPGDVGVLATIFLNAVELAPGDALSVGAGVVHCYVSGLGLEVMANSDNVMRAGLTSKRIDLDELLRIVDFSEGGAIISRPEPQRIPGTPSSVRCFDTPASEYAVKLYTITDGAFPVTVTDTAGPRVVLGLSGAVVVSAAGGRIALAAGDGALGLDGEELRLSGQGAVAVIRVPGASS